MIIKSNISFQDVLSISQTDAVDLSFIMELILFLEFIGV